MFDFLKFYTKKIEEKFENSDQRLVDVYIWYDDALNTFLGYAVSISPNHVIYKTSYEFTPENVIYKDVEVL